MRRIVLFLMIVLVLSTLVAPAAAQTTTETPAPNSQGQNNSQSNSQNNSQNNSQSNTTGTNQTGQQTVRVRLANFVADSPTFVVYVNDAPSGIQNLTFPSMSGWVELPNNSVTLSFIPQGAARSQ